MTAQFPRVIIMIPMVFSGWGHIPILNTPKFHSVSFHIPIIWLVYTPLCWWLLMLNHQGQKPKPTYPIVSWRIVSLMKISIIRFIHVQPFLWAPRISWYTHRPWMHLMRFWSVLWLHDGKVYRTPLQFMVVKHIFLCMFFFTPINWK